MPTIRKLRIVRKLDARKAKLFGHLQSPRALPIEHGCIAAIGFLHTTYRHNLILNHLILRIKKYNHIFETPCVSGIRKLLFSNKMLLILITKPGRSIREHILCSPYMQPFLPETGLFSISLL